MQQAELCLMAEDGTVRNESSWCRFPSIPTTRALSSITATQDYPKRNIIFGATRNHTPSETNTPKSNLTVHLARRRNVGKEAQSPFAHRDIVSCRNDIRIRLVERSTGLDVIEDGLLFHSQHILAEIGHHHQVVREKYKNDDEIL
jgi:hypothetical protein